MNGRLSCANRLIACAIASLSPVRADTMSVIIPRFEWRTFGRSFGAAEAAFAAMTPTGTADSDETYLLSSDPATRVAPTAIVKIRFELMDIKVLREVTAEGLERWEPVLKVGSPMPAADVARVCEALGLEAPSPAARPHARAVPGDVRRTRRAGPRRRGPQAPRPLHRRRLLVRGLRRRRRRQVHADHRDRVGGPGGRRRGGPLRRPRGLRQHELSARAWPRSSTASPSATP